ncbi:MAG: hypothetical protein ACI9MC_003891 [Kiritimatiellia bacterium]|jgi:hypothetical protein
MRQLMVIVGLLAVGCNQVDIDIDTDPGTEPPEFGNGRSNGEQAPERVADSTIKADLTDGIVIDLDWAATGGMGCWSANEDLNFDGAHWFHEVSQAPLDDLMVRVTPKVDVDVSVYAIQLDDGSTNLPPDMQTAWSCEASGDYAHDSNPGVAEVLRVGGLDGTHRVIIGVAGAGGVVAGAFQVEVWNEASD